MTIPELLPKVLKAQQLMNQSSEILKFIISVNLDGFKPDNVWDFHEMVDPSIDTSILKKSRSNTDVAVMPYSSGTTGLSKGVSLSHRNIMANLAQIDYPEISHILDTTGKNIYRTNKNKNKII